MFSTLKLAKIFAKRLRYHASLSGCDRPLHVFQEIIARALLYKDWYDLIQSIKHNPHAPSREVVIRLLAREFAALPGNLSAELIFEAIFPTTEEKMILHADGAGFAGSPASPETSSYIESFISSGLPGLVEFRSGDQSLLVKLLPFRDHLPVFAYARICPSDQVPHEFRHPLYLQTLGRPPESWFSPSLRSICKTFAFDLERLRPEYQNNTWAHELLCAADKAHYPLEFSLKHGWSFELLITALDMLVEPPKKIEEHKLSDARRAARYLFHSGEPGRFWGNTLPSDEMRTKIKENGLEEAYFLAARIVLEQKYNDVMSDNCYIAPFHFLPSEYGTGCQPSLYGWPGTQRWLDNYGDLAGVALLPEIGPDDLAKRAAFDAFSRLGRVRFLSRDEAQKYLDEEGSDWASYWKHGRVPRELDLSRRNRIVSTVRLKARSMWNKLRKE